MGAALEFEIATPLGLCREPITDGAGEWVGFGIGLKQSLYEMVRSSDPGQLSTIFQIALSGEANEQGLPLAPQPSGYQAIDPGNFAPGPFQRYDAEGHLLSEGGTLAPGIRIRPLPGGGSAVYTLESDPLQGRTTHRLELMDASGVRTATADLDRPIVNHAVSTRGHVLVLGADSARWYDANAAPLTPWFSVSSAAGSLVTAQLMPVAGGDVALANGTWPSERTWRAMFRDGVGSDAPVPDWLAARPDTRAFVVRGGKATVIVPRSYPERDVDPAARNSCAGELEVLTPSGESCGTLTLPGARCGNTLFVGIEGTVFSMRQGTDGLCTWQWWAGLLR